MTFLFVLMEFKFTREIFQEFQLSNIWNFMHKEKKIGTYFPTTEVQEFMISFVTVCFPHLIEHINIINIISSDSTMR